VTPGDSTTGAAVEVFADLCCPFTHVGLLRMVDERAAQGRDDVVLRVRAWPLEVVNGAPLDPVFIAEEVEEIRAQVAPDLFAGFSPAVMPSTSIPGMVLAHHAYRRDPRLGETVSLELRALLFEKGVDISATDVLLDVGRRHGLTVTADDLGDDRAVLADLTEGRARGVVGSPHFFTGDGGFFCPALDISRDDRGHLRILADPEGFAEFTRSCFARR
jgi:predicted DsbA family dithiol-disulfide isomerase